jgi:hypothetical protein
VTDFSGSIVGVAGGAVGDLTGSTVSAVVPITGILGGGLTSIISPLTASVGGVVSSVTQNIPGLGGLGTGIKVIGFVLVGGVILLIIAIFRGFRKAAS